MTTMTNSAYGFAFGEAFYPNGGVFGPLLNKHVSLVLMTEGAATITCDNDSVRLEKGQCAVFRNDRYYLAEYERGLSDRVTWCETMPATLPESVVQKLRGKPIQLQTSHQVATLQRFGIQLGRGMNQSANMLRNAIGYALFMEFFHEAHILEESLNIPKPVVLVRSTIEHSYARTFTVSELADTVGITSQHLNTLFRRHVGETPIRYLWRKRAERGHFLLLHSGLSVSEIAYQCGYKTPFHFSRHIKQLFGLSPKAVRHQRGFRTPANEAENTANAIFS